MSPTSLPRPLDEVAAGGHFEIHSVHGSRAMLRRVLRLGLLEGCRLSVTTQRSGELVCRTRGGCGLRVPCSVAHCIWVVPDAPLSAT